MLETSASESLFGSQFTLSVDKTKLTILLTGLLPILLMLSLVSALLITQGQVAQSPIKLTQG